MSLEKDIAVFRSKCCQMEFHLPIFNSLQVSPMSDAQSIRHGLYLIRCEIDRLADRIKQLEVEYPDANTNCFVSIEP